MSPQYGFHSYYSGQEPDAIVVTVENFLDSYSPGERILQRGACSVFNHPIHTNSTKKKNTQVTTLQWLIGGKAVYVSNGQNG